MSKLIKVLWSVCSFAPFLFVIAIVFLIDFFTLQDLTNSIFPAVIFIILVILFFILVFWILSICVQKLEKTTLIIKEIESKDEASALTMVSYLITISTVNQVSAPAIYAMLVIVFFMLVITKIIFVNPLLYFLRYRYYKAKAMSGVSYTLISKRSRVSPSSIKNVVEIFPEIYLEV